MIVKEWLQKAKEEKFALGAFNIGNLETFKAVSQAAQSKKSPVIVETSPGETTWFGAENIVDLARNFSRDFNIPILVNLDHAGSLEECMAGIEAGYDMIHFDGSKLSLEENIETVKKVVETAHRKGLTVEGEIDHIMGSSEVHSGSAVKVMENVPLTDPEKARQFVKATGIDILAVFIGNAHGIYTQGGENLRLDVLEQLAQILPNVYFSLHGGSGIPDEQIKEAIKYGVVKINVNTQLRRAFKENLAQSLKENPQEYAMYKIEQPVVEQVQKVVEQKIEIFSSGGKING